jgi:polar amino acid transport system substrate-binding protein
MLFKIVLSLLSSLLILGCSTNEETLTVEKKKVLHVAMATNYPPLAFKERGTIKGVEVDLARLLAKELNRDLIIDESEWTTLPELLNGNYIDMAMSGISITKKRSHMVLFSEPFMSVSQMALLKEGTSAPNIDAKGRGRRIGFSKYTTGEMFVKKSFTLATLKEYKNLRFGIAALLNGEIDYFFYDSPAIWYYSTNNSITGVMGWNVPYTQERIAWAFGTNNTQLKKQVDAVIRKWQQDGTFKRVFNRWIPVRVSQLPSSQLISFE